MQICEEMLKMPYEKLCLMLILIIFREMVGNVSERRNPVSYTHLFWDVLFSWHSYLLQRCLCHYPVKRINNSIRLIHLSTFLRCCPIL